MLEKDLCRQVARVDGDSEDVGMRKVRGRHLPKGYEAEGG